MHQAIAGPNASFDPLDADLRGGDWTLTPIRTSTLLMPAFSQAILIDPDAGIVLHGDYDSDIDGNDFLAWQRMLGSPAGSLPNDPTGVAIWAAQLDVWKGNFGATLSQPQAAVPEPHTFVSALTG